jgi:hypothetical protein
LERFFLAPGTSLISGQVAPRLTWPSMFGLYFLSLHLAAAVL